MNRFIPAVLVFAALTGLAGAQSQADYYGPEAVDLTSQGEPSLNPAKVNSIYTIDPATGTLTLHIPILTLPNSGRGPAAVYTLNYSSAISPYVAGTFTPPGYLYASPELSWMWAGPGGVGGAGGWSAGGPSLSTSYTDLTAVGADGSTPINCDEWGPYIFNDGGGSNHDLGVIHVDDEALGWGLGSACLDAENDQSQAVDDFAVNTTLDPSTGSVRYIKTGNGLTYFPAAPGGAPGGIGAIEDSNGNILTLDPYGDWIDATGRTVMTVTAGYDALPASIKTYDSAGHAQVYTITWGTISASGFDMPNPNSTNCGMVPNCFADPFVPAGGGIGITGITLPDGTSYTFGYDSTFGMINSIVLPTGAHVTFTYGIQSQANMISGAGTQAVADSVAVTSETVTGSGSGSDGTWNYAYSTTHWGVWGEGSKQTVITDPLGEATTITYAPIGLASSMSSGGVAYRALEVQRDVASSSGTVLRRTLTGYLGVVSCPYGCTAASAWMEPESLMPAGVTTILEPASTNLASQKSFYYDAFNNVTEEDDYDFGSFTSGCVPVQPNNLWYGGGTGPVINCGGAQLRKTVNTYLATFGGVNYTDPSVWIVNRLATQLISDGAGTTYAQSSFGYDNYSGSYSTLTASGAAVHDSAYSTLFTARGNQTSASRWVGGGTWLTSYAAFDDAGKVRKTYDTALNPTTYDYTDNYADTSCLPAGPSDAYPKTITNALGQVTTLSWNSCTGTLASNTDPNGATTAYTYADPGGMDRLVQVLKPDPGSGIHGETDYTYTDVSAAFTVETKERIDASRWTDSTTYFDGLGRTFLTSTFNDEATPYDQTVTTYDTLNRVAFQSYPCQSSSAATRAGCSWTGDTFGYDALSRPTLTTHSDGSTFITSYAGRASETQDEGNGSARVTRVTQRDGLGHLRLVCEATGASDAAGNVPSPCPGMDIAPTGFETVYTPDPLGNLRQAYQPGSATSVTRSFSFDGLSRLTSSSNPETGPIAYQFDGDSSCLSLLSTYEPSNGDLASRVDARGVKTCYQWDALHRVVKKVYSDGTPPVTYTFDQSSEWGWATSNGVGRLTLEQTGGTSDTPPSSGAIFSYDAMGRVVHQGACTPDTCGWGGYDFYPTYDLLGDVLTSAYAVGADTVTATYNRAGRPTSLATSYGAVINSISYGNRGLEQSTALANGVTESRSYEPVRGGLSDLTAGSAYNFHVTSFAPDGDVLATTDPVNNNFQYSFNGLGQLTQVCTPSCEGTVYNYSYDRFGNRWAANTPGSAVPATFGTGNRMLGASYDAAGNLLNDGAHSYTFDAENRVASVDGGAVLYVYDAEGRRVHEDVDGVVEEFEYGVGPQAFTVVNGGGTPVQSELSLNGRRVATLDGGTLSWAHSDGLGTLRQNTNASGGPAGAYSSLPFGEDLSAVGTVTALHFTGKYRDGESGLDYFGARYYSSALGRFLTPDWSEEPDPIPYADLENPQSLNLYAYVGNNPVTDSDADGHLLGLGEVAATNCTVDGFDSFCGGLGGNGAVQSDAVAGYGTDPFSGLNAFLKPTALAGGAFAMLSAADFSVYGVNVYDGTVLDNAQFQAQLKVDYPQTIAGQIDSVATAAKTDTTNPSALNEADISVSGGNVNVGGNGLKAASGQCEAESNGGSRCGDGGHVYDNHMHLDGGQAGIGHPLGTLKHFWRDVFLGNVGYWVLPPIEP